MHGPKGVGCLWISDRLLNRVKPSELALIIGGGQQSGFRSGTLNVPGIVGFGKAAALACGEDVERHVVSAIASRFEEELQRLCDANSIKVIFNFQNNKRHDKKILSITFPGADSETVVMLAGQNGLCISNGAACNSVSSEPSYVLTQSGISPNYARNTVRVSFSRYNEYTEAKYSAEILVDAVKEVLSLTGSTV